MGIFRVADAKLCFYSNWSVSQAALNEMRGRRPALGGMVSDGRNKVLTDSKKLKTKTDIYSRLFKLLKAELVSLVPKENRGAQRSLKGMKSEADQMKQNI